MGARGCAHLTAVRRDDVRKMLQHIGAARIYDCAERWGQRGEL